MIALAGVSCASASSDFNDTAVENDYDIASVNDDLGDVIADNVPVNNATDVEDGITNDVTVNNKYMNFTKSLRSCIFYPKYHAEITHLSPTIMHCHFGDVVHHSIKVRIVDDNGNGIANAPVILNVYYDHYKTELSFNLLDDTGYEQRAETDGEGYVVFSYMVSPESYMYAYCWIKPATDYLILNSLFNPQFPKIMWSENVDGDYHKWVSV